MKTADELKQIVREKYGAIANQTTAENKASCCGSGCMSQEVYNIMTEDYDNIAGYNPDADLGLGCGLPTQFAQISKGDTVIDLGSGAGNDCFIARHETGASGRVIGIDFTDAMIAKARINADKLGFNNVEFRQGDIEAMPVADETADVMISNCVLNLVPDKKRVISEIYRTLKPGGHFSISDIVLVGDLPEALQEDAEMYAGCVSGAIQKSDYLGLIREQGFEELTLQKESRINIPDDILSRYLDEPARAAFNSGETGIFSITVFGRKPGVKPQRQNVTDEAEAKECCPPGSGCC